MKRLWILFVCLFIGISMASPDFLTGFEPGVLSINGGGLFDAISGSPIVQSTIKRTGNYALKIAPSAAYEYVRKNLSGSPTYIVGRNYVYFDDLPNESPTLIIGNAVLYFRIRYDSGVNKFKVRCGAGTTQYSSMTLSADTWYRIDFRMWCGDENWYIDWQINGTAQTQATYTNVASSFTHIDIGNSDSAETYVLYVDDVIISDSPSDYPFGEGQVIGLSPVAGATGSNPGSVIADDGDMVVDDSTNPAYVELDDVPMDGGTDYIQQTANGTDNFAEVKFAPLSGAGQINGVMGLVAYESEATQTNHGKTVIRNSDLYDSVIYDGDMSESSRFYKSAIVTPPSGGWSQSEVNALLGRVGYSSDANPDPCWHSLMIEVDYVPGAGEDLVKVINETEQITEGIVKLSGLIRIIDETENLTEGTIRVRDLVRILNESEQVSEGIIRSRDLVRIIDETENLNENIVRLKSMVRIIDEDEQITEAKSKVLGFVRVVNETEQISETSSKVLGFVRIVNETVQISEGLVKLTGLIRIVDETLQLTEGIIRTRDLVRIIDESISIQEAIIRARDLVRTINESVNIQEDSMRIRGMIRIIDETLNVTEGIIRELVVPLIYPILFQVEPRERLFNVKSRQRIFRVEPRERQSDPKKRGN